MEAGTLHYFQYLAAFYTEIVLDRYFNRHAQLLADLNAFVHERNAAKAPGEPPDEVFVRNPHLLNFLVCSSIH